MAPHRHRDRALAIALLASLVLWNLPFGGLLLYPFKLLATWMHELSHGLIMLLSGAGFDRIEIYRDTSGLAFAERGVGPYARAAIAAAGYMGTPLLGAIILIWGQTRRRARVILMVLGAAMAVSAVVFVDNTFGAVAVGVGAGLCLVGFVMASERVAMVLVNFIAAQACINALLDIRVLFRANLVVNGKNMGNSDAHNMAEATFGSPTLWASIWLAWSIVLLYAALRLVYLHRKRQRARASAADDPTQDSLRDPVGA
ncbi:MAG: M50 family metallopeptidase [Proteobacteria bacterium]|nr:M50 family metallopeptidase [Pseudomonadota bacterium]